MPELEEISEVIWFNLTSHPRDGAAEAQGGEMVAGLSSRTCKKLVWCSFHNTSGSQTARENGLQCLCTQAEGHHCQVPASVTLGGVWEHF